MTQKRWLNLAPSLLMGIGIIASTIIAKRTAEAGWLVMAGPLLLALAVVSADMLDAWLRSEPVVPTRGALTLGTTFVLAAWIVALRDPALVKTLIPVIGASAWVTILLRPGDGRKWCRWL